MVLGVPEGRLRGFCVRRTGCSPDAVLRGPLISCYRVRFLLFCKFESALRPDSGRSCRTHTCCPGSQVVCNIQRDAVSRRSRCPQWPTTMNTHINAVCVPRGIACERCHQDARFYPSRAVDAMYARVDIRTMSAGRFPWYLAPPCEHAHDDLLTIRPDDPPRGPR